MNIPILSFSLLSRNRRKKSPSPKKNITRKYVPAMVRANEYDDSPTEEMIERGRHKPGFSIDPTYTKQIQELMIRPKKGGKRRTLRTHLRNRKLFRK